MKRFVHPSFFLLFFMVLLCTALPSGRLQAQDGLQHRLQVSMQLLQGNFAQPVVMTVRSRNIVQPFSGLMLQYRLQRWAIRVGGSFSRNETSNAGNHCFECGIGKLHGFDYQLRAGAQFSLSQRLEWLYLFGDLHYRYAQGEGTDVNPLFDMIPYQFSQTETGMGAQLGMGAQMPIYRNLSVTLEGFLANELLKFTYRAPQFPPRLPFMNSLRLLNPGARLYLSMRF